MCDVIARDIIVPCAHTLGACKAAKRNIHETPRRRKKTARERESLLCKCAIQPCSGHVTHFASEPTRLLLYNSSLLLSSSLFELPKHVRDLLRENIRSRRVHVVRRIVNETLNARPGLSVAFHATCASLVELLDSSLYLDIFII